MPEGTRLIAPYPWHHGAAGGNAAVYDRDGTHLFTICGPDSQAIAAGVCLLSVLGMVAAEAPATAPVARQRRRA